MCQWSLIARPGGYPGCLSSCSYYAHLNYSIPPYRRRLNGLRTLDLLSNLWTCSPSRGVRGDQCPVLVTRRGFEPTEYRRERPVT